MMLKVVPSALLVLRTERPDRQEPDARRGAQHRAARRDRAGHAGAVRMRRASSAGRRNSADDRAGEIGMRGIDAGIDHRDQHAVAGREPMRLGEIELLRRILVAVGGSAACVSSNR